MRIAGFVLLLFSMACTGPSTENPTLPFAVDSLPLIPQPQLVNQGEGIFLWSDSLTIFASKAASEESSWFQKKLVESGFKVRQIKTPDGASPIQTIELLCDSAGFYSGKTHYESYTLEVTDHKIVVKATYATGLFRGLQTLLQLLETHSSTGALPAMYIEDQPAFAHRGMLFDVCRHFFDKEVVKNYIDLLAFYKMNTLHWHLTEDQGWRIAIDAYTKLTEISAWRTLQDGSQYGGFYTKDEIREVVEYARQHHIQVIPEIEIPGHAQAALAAYPQFSCAGGPIEVANDWGVFKEIYCAGNDSTFIFLKTVLTEVMDLFPSQFIHIGGDEAPKARWEKCKRCQQRITREGLADEHELQSWFIGEIDEFLQKNNRTLIGWDEILEGGLTPGAVVQSWRGTEGGINAAKAGQYAIMSPTSHCYFDYDLRAIDLKKVYGFNPIPESLSEEYQHFILGGECNLWTEHIPDRKTLDRQAFPRLTAMSEVLWTAPEIRDFDHFRNRLSHHYPLLRKRNVQFGAETVPYTASTTWHDDSLWLHIETTQDGLSVNIRESNDKEAVTYASKKQVLPGKTSRYYIQAQINDLPVGTEDELLLHAHQAIGAEVIYQTPFSPYYPGGEHALTDGFLGSTRFRDGRWQGFSGHDAVLVIDLGTEKSVRSVSLNAHQYNNAWIFLPEEVLFFGGTDTTAFTALGNVKPQADPAQRGQFNENLSTSFAPVSLRFIKVQAKNIGVVPQWHEAAGSEAWLFLDEIVVE